MRPEEQFEEYRAHPDREHLRALLEAFQGPIYTVAFQILRHPQNAEDATQLVFLKLLESLAKFTDGEHLKRWVYRAALHTALDVKRSEGRRKSHEARVAAPAEASSPPPPGTPETGLHERLAELDDPERVILVEHYYHRRPLSDLAAEQGCSPVAVWKRLEKARGALRRSLALAGLTTLAAGMESMLEASVPVTPPPALLSPSLLTKAAALAGGSPGPGLSTAGGWTLKVKSLVALSALALVGATFGYRALLLGPEPPVPPRLSAISPSHSLRPSEPIGTGVSPSEPEIPASAYAPKEPSSPARGRPVRRVLGRLLLALQSKDPEALKAGLASLREEITPAPVPERANAAVLYRKAFEKFQWGDEESTRWADLAGQDPLTLADRLELKALLEKNQEALGLLHQAAELPGCNFDIDYSKGMSVELPHIRNLLVGAKLLATEALVSDPDDLAGAVRASGRLAEALADEPILISQLVRGVCQTMASEGRERELDQATDPEILRGMLGLPSSDALRASFQKCILFEAYSVAAAVSGAGDSGAGLDQLGFPTVDQVTLQPALEHYLETLSQFSDLLERPYYEMKGDLELLLQERVSGAPDYASLDRLLAPAFGKVCLRLAETEATVGTAQVATAIRLYQVDHGTYPESLSALGPILGAPPLDPFTGNPYLYRREGPGFVVYSVGSDGLDNGGISREKDILIRLQK